MAQVSDRAALTLLISSTMAYCEREIDAMCHIPCDYTAAS